MSFNNTKKVLFIAGPGRSGSTLLDMLLGQIDGFCSTGELRFIWKRGFGQNQLCGCGNPFKECDFWTEVVQEAFGGFHNVDYERLESLRYAIEHRGSKWTSSINTSGPPPSFNEYVDAYNNIYQAIHKISGCEFIVDSSKKVAHGLILSTIPEIDLFILHLIRDSRAVVYSWQRKKVRPEIYWKQQFMSHRGVLKSAKRWSSHNILAHKLLGSRKQYSLLRYEDLANRPKYNLLKQLNNLGIESPSLDFVNGSTAKLKVCHTVSGNPVRFERKEIKIQPDMQWKTDMSGYHKWLVTLLTWPLLWKFGYFKDGRITGEAASSIPQNNR